MLDRISKNSCSHNHHHQGLGLSSFRKAGNQFYPQWPGVPVYVGCTAFWSHILRQNLTLVFRLSPSLLWVKQQRLSSRVTGRLTCHPLDPGWKTVRCHKSQAMQIFVDYDEILHKKGNAATTKSETCNDCDTGGTWFSNHVQPPACPPSLHPCFLRPGRSICSPLRPLTLPCTYRYHLSLTTIL